MSEIILVIILVLFLIGVWGVYSQKKEEKEKRKKELLNIANQLSYHLDKVNNAKTLNTKLKNCDKAIELLHVAGAYSERREIITNYDELNEKIYSIKKVLPVVAEMKKADKNKFKGKDNSEKDNLLNALYEIKQNAVENDDFEIASAYDDETGEIISIEMIEERLSELGWEKQ